MDASTLTEKKEGKKFNEIYQKVEKGKEKNDFNFSVESIIEEAKKTRTNDIKNNEKKFSQMMSNGEFLTNTDDIDSLLATIEKDLLSKK